MQFFVGYNLYNYTLNFTTTTAFSYEYYIEYGADMCIYTHIHAYRLMSTDVFIYYAYAFNNIQQNIITIFILYHLMHTGSTDIRMY